MCCLVHIEIHIKKKKIICFHEAFQSRSTISIDNHILYKQILETCAISNVSGVTIILSLHR